MCSTLHIFRLDDLYNKNVKIYHSMEASMQNSLPSFIRNTIDKVITYPYITLDKSHSTSSKLDTLTTYNQMALSQLSHRT